MNLRLLRVEGFKVENNKLNRPGVFIEESDFHRVWSDFTGISGLKLIQYQVQFQFQLLKNRFLFWKWIISIYKKVYGHSNFDIYLKTSVGFIMIIWYFCLKKMIQWKVSFKITTVPKIALIPDPYRSTKNLKYIMGN